MCMYREGRHLDVCVFLWYVIIPVYFQSSELGNTGAYADSCRVSPLSHLQDFSVWGFCLMSSSISCVCRVRHSVASASFLPLILQHTFFVSENFFIELQEVDVDRKLTQ